MAEKRNYCYGDTVYGMMGAEARKITQQEEYNRLWCAELDRIRKEREAKND